MSLEPKIMRDIRKLASDISNINRRLKTVEFNSQSPYRSVSSGGTTYYDDQGNIRTIIGAVPGNPDVFTSVDYNGAAPEVPSDPIIIPGPGSVTIVWDGFDRYAKADWLPDFSRVEVHVDSNPDALPTDFNQIASFNSKAGGSVTINLPPGEPFYTSFTAANTSGVESASTPVIDTIADPIEVSEPTVPPASSPNIVATGMPTTIVLRTDNVAPTDLIEYHVSTVSGFYPSASTKLPNTPTRAQVYVAKSLPDGTVFNADTTYYFRAVAVNAATQSYTDTPPSPEVAGTLDLTAIATLVASTLIAEIITAALVNVGPAQFDANMGLVIPQSDGVSVIRLPVNVNQDATIPNLAVRRLSVELGAVLGGQSRVTGTLTASAGIIAPQVLPSVTSDQDYISLGKARSIGASLYGLSMDANGRWLTIQAPEEGNAALMVYDSGSFSGTTVPTVGTYLLDSGIVRLGSTLYVLGRRTDTKQLRWWLFDATSLNYLGTQQLFVQDNNNRASISASGSNLYITTVKNSTQWRTTIVDQNGTIGTSYDLTHGYATSQSIGGSYGGDATAAPAAAELGASGSQVVAPAVNSDIQVFNTSHNRLSNYAWQRAGNTTVRGLYFDGTRFWHLDNNGQLRKYATGNPITRTISVGYTYYDGDTSSGSTVHETGLSLQQNYSWPARSRLIVETQPPPDAADMDASHRDRANQIRVYYNTDIAPGDIGNPGAPNKLQATIISAPWRAVLEGVLNGAAPRTDVPFPMTAVGTLRSTGLINSNPAWQFIGDGSGSVPGYSWTAGGITQLDTVNGSIGAGTFRDAVDARITTVIPNKFGIGTVSITTNGTPASLNVTFAVPYPNNYDIPTVVASVRTGSPQLFDIGISNESRTGFTVTMNRTSGAQAANFSWIATSKIT